MIEIILATYGDVGVTTVSGSRIDVTKQVTGKISTDGQTLSINVSPANIGVADPAVGKSKSLITNYRVNGEENTTTTFDGAMLAVSAPSYVPKTPAGYVYSLMGSVWSNGFAAVGVFLYFLSVSLAFNIGGLVFGIVAALMPYSTFWLFAPVMFILSALQGSVYWTPSGGPSASGVSGGRRRRKR